MSANTISMKQTCCQVNICLVILLYYKLVTHRNPYIIKVLSGLTVLTQLHLNKHFGKNNYLRADVLSIDQIN